MLKTPNGYGEETKANSYLGVTEERTVNSIERKEHLQQDELTVPYESQVQSDEPQVSTKSELILNYRIWIVVMLAMFVRYLNLIVEKCNSTIEVEISGLYIKQIFMPLIMYEVFELSFLRPQFQSNNFLSTLLVLTNIQPKFLSKLLTIFNIFTKFFQDLLVYFFTFIMCDCLIEAVF